MNLNIKVNDYILIWNLLFQTSVTPAIQKLKERLWQNYKEEYHSLYMEKEVILQDPENYIPKDDTLYNIIMESHEYEVVRKQTDKSRNNLLAIWDKDKKKINLLLQKILKDEPVSYQIYVIDSRFNSMETSSYNSLIFGLAVESDNKVSVLTNLLYSLLKRRYLTTFASFPDLVKAILELAILNEFPTRYTGTSYYLAGDLGLNYIKRQLYPYFLMYLGVAKNEFAVYMARDKILFDVGSYTYERNLEYISISQFITFCIHNKDILIKKDVVNV